MTYTEHWLELAKPVRSRYVLTHCYWCGEDYDVKVGAVAQSIRSHQRTEPHKQARKRLEAA